MVLEARENAEKIWFPVVWDAVKDASNVIEYNIREEQTIDTSSVLNANNQTTTGMANVIPWINAPKLIYSTSIIWWQWWESSLQATATWWIAHSFDWYWTYNASITSFTLTDESWTLELKQVAQWLEIPAEWVYMLDMEYQWINWYTNCTDNIQVNWTTVHSFVWSRSKYWWNNPKEKVFLKFNKWDIISLYIESGWNDSSYFNFDHNVTMKFTKL